MTPSTIDRRLTKLEQDARSSRPVNLTSPPTNPGIYFPRLRDALGASAFGWPSFYPDGCQGDLLIPSIAQAVPFVPQTISECRAKSQEYCLNAFIETYTWRFFAIDASQTGNTIEGYFIHHNQAGTSKRSSVGILTKSTESTTKGTTEFYWKGGIQFTDNETPPAGRQTPEITTATSTHTITAVTVSPPALTISGDHTAVFKSGRQFTISGSSGNDGQYTVKNATYNTTTASTKIIPIEAIPNATVSGSIAIGAPLLLYSQTNDINKLRPYFNAYRPKVRYNEAKNLWYYTPGDNYNPTLGRPYSIETNNIPALLLEHIPNYLIPKGCYAIEAAGDNLYALRLRYRHHTSGDIYQTLIDCPTIKSTGSIVYAAHTDLVGNEIWACFGQSDGILGANPYWRQATLSAITLPP